MGIYISRWGKNNDSKLGTKQQNLNLPPTKVEFFKDMFVMDVSLGREHMGVLTGM